MMYMHSEMMWMVFCFVFGIILLVGIVLLIVWVVRKLEPHKSAKTALDTLNRRYASGEISREEYERMKRDIS